jgi:hypothetical protein
MKAGYYLGGLALGLIIGGGIGYMIACDPQKRAKIDDFLADIGDKASDVSDKVKAALGLEDSDELTEEDIIAIETALAPKLSKTGKRSATKEK